MRTIKLMPDYESYPLWEASPGATGNIDPSDLPISQSLTDRLLKWADAFDATLNRDDPASSGFPDDDSKAAFSDEGRELEALLKAELGADYSVISKL